MGIKPYLISAFSRQGILTAKAFLLYPCRGAHPSPKSGLSLLLSGPSPTAFPWTTRASALLIPLPVFQKGCFLWPPGHCSCCPLCLECPSPSPFLPLANATLSLTVMAWVTWAGCCSFFSSSMLPLLPLCPPTGPMVKLGYRFVSLPVPWSGCLGGSSMEHSAQPGTYQHPAQPRPTSSPCVLRSWI